MAQLQAVGKAGVGSVASGTPQLCGDIPKPCEVSSQLPESKSAFCVSAWLQSCQVLFLPRHVKEPNTPEVS